MSKRNGSERGFTLMEMLASVTVLMVLAVTAVGMFSRSLRSSAYVESQRLLDGSAKTIIDSMSRYLRESRMVSLDGMDKEVCIISGSIAGSNLVVTGSDAVNSTFELQGDNIASNSSILNPESVEISNFLVDWTCTQGTPDKLDIGFSARLSSATNFEGIEDNLKLKDYSFGITLRNSKY